MTRVFVSWQWDPATVGLVLVLGAAYLLAVRRLHRAGSAWPRARTRTFIGALCVVMIVRMSFLGVYSPILFWDRALQNILLLMTTSLLVAMSAPLSLVLSQLPPSLATPLRRAGRSRAAKLLTFPVVVTVVLVSPLPVIYLSPLYEMALRSPLITGLTQLWLVCAGFVYYWTRLQVDPTPRGDHHLVSLWISITEGVFDGALGLIVAFGPLIAPGYYTELHRMWGPSMRLDQMFGGGVLWVVGDVAALPFVGALFVRWRHDDVEQAEQMDRELDERELAGENVQETGLWWENDPVFADDHRFKRG